jgi:RNA-splicing ligase RtcB
MSKPLKISEEAAVQMPMKTVASLIIIVALGTMGYFQMIERLNVADTRLQIMEKDLNENTEFRIKWPRGQLGSLPADSEQFMMIEDFNKTNGKSFK